jgi:hypothetical protein
MFPANTRSRGKNLKGLSHNKIVHKALDGLRS